jgi:uncharacterized DUF497 family protein
VQLADAATQSANCRTARGRRPAAASARYGQTVVAASNLRAHGIAFPEAVGVFLDPFGIEWADDREGHGEEPLNLIGMHLGVIFHVTFTERRHGIRLISARRAETHEQDHYYRENAV